MIDLLYCFDENYNVQAFLSIKSFIQHNDTQININIIHKNPDTFLEYSEEIVGIKNVNLEIKKFELVARSYPSPGISTEFFHQYVGIVELPDSSNLIAGLLSESEDIRSHIFSYQAFSDLISEGKIKVGPAILIGLWLSKNRDLIREKYSK